AGGGAGNDVMDNWFTKSTLHGSTTMNLMGGTGADTVGIIIDYDVAPGASALFDIDCGDGTDVVGFVVIGGTIARYASVGSDMHGGAGADVLGHSTDALAIDAGGHFRACLEGKGEKDVLDTSSSAYGTGV